MARNQLRWGVLGAARIARNAVIPAIRKSCNGEVRALASRSAERGQEVAREHGIPLTYDRYEAVLGDPQIDAVYIPLPNHLHREWSVRAMQAGKHVLCEKPLALDADEAQEMADAARTAGVLLMEAFMYRFHPRSRRVKELVDEGAIGDPRLIRAAFCFGQVAPADYRLRPEMGGGALLDVGCYGVNVARWLFGAEPEAAQTSAEVGPTGVDLTFAGLLRFPGDRLAVVEASFKTAMQQTYTVVGTEGAIDLPHDAFVPGVKKVTFRLRGVDDGKGKTETVHGADEYQLMVEHFADAVLTQGTLDFPPEEAVANARVLDALAQAARKDHPATVRR
jgi:xylose dehydrogenase (NAD/NADP)